MIEQKIPDDTFIRTDRLCRDSAELACRLADVDAIVAVARSGLLPASIVAVNLQRPLWCVSQASGVSFVGHGSRLRGDRTLPRSVVVIDDTAYHGTAMRDAVEKVRKYFPKSKVKTAVVYAHPKGRPAVDHCYAIYGGPHYLEWNFFNGPFDGRAAYDLDGIICHDPSTDEDDDGPRYALFLRTARPLYLPRRSPVAAIVTARPESARAATVDWLARHGVRFERLVMRGFSRPAASDWLNMIADFKAREFAALGCELFVESCPALAKEIARRAGRPVLCPALGRVVRADSRADTPFAK